jgi:hypothetical protein
MRHPSILIPYPGPTDDPSVEDIAVYLRPEANGVKVESTILGVIHKNPDYRRALQIVYLANLPGDFLVANRVIEEHYALNIRFAKEGKEAFTPSMRMQFERKFGCSFEDSDLIGPFETLDRLSMNEDELFQLWVPPRDFVSINGQSIKRYKNLFIINYDIPALLKRNSMQTDIFSMILRSFLTYKEFHELIDSINLALKGAGIISNPVLYSHVFHYSKGPFEQILDGKGYIYREEDKHIELSELSFFSYLLSKGCSEVQIMEAINNPIMQFRTNGGVEEKNLMIHTYDDSFEDAFEKFESRL